jgi:predicted TIM-barrel fold metal-dependent hydrolase
MLPACDCHFHVIAPPAQFPLHLARSYTPPEASLDDWRATLAPLAITRGVLVQPSFYGTDNRALLAALAAGEGQLVGVAAAAADISEAGLDALADAGVRGLRLAHFNAGDPRGMAGFVALSELPALAPRLRARGLHVNLFTDTRLLADIEGLLRAAQLPVVLDHMGRTPAALGADHAGTHALRRLLDQGWCWVKLSGLANISEQAPLYEDARLLHELLVCHHADRLVWGSDWPHTRPHGVRPATRDLLDCFLEWTPREAVRQLILVDNASQLYGFSATSPQCAPKATVSSLSTDVLPG